MRVPGGDVRTWTSRLLLAISVGTVTASVASLWFLLPAVVSSLLAGRLMTRSWPAPAAFATALLAGAVTMARVPAALPAGTTLAAAAVFAGMVPWLAGFAWRQSVALTRAGWERAERLEREQRLADEQARLRERTRIAQDMHDVLGHDLNLLALRAGALSLDPSLGEAHRAAAAGIRAAAAAAVQRLGAIVGVLHEPADPGPPDVAALVDAAAAAGLDVRLTVRGEPPTDAPLHHHAVVRVVQEALTNIAKHAPAAAAEVTVDHTGAATVVEVVNGPAPAPGTPPAGGHGLVGLDERVRLLGGTLRAGPDGAGWAVRARVPHVAGEATEPGPGATAVHRTRAKRRVRRSVLALATLPLITFALLTAALWTWTGHLTGRAVLPADAYASLRVGQDRAQIAPLLPPAQAPNPPPAPVPPGARCEFYAITSDQFDSRSGDAYRLCFRGSTLISLDTLRW